jgi:hypothetical protein
MPIYAQIQASRVVAVTQTAEPVVALNMIQIDEFDAQKLGMVYEDGEFSEPVED